MLKTVILILDESTNNEPATEAAREFSLQHGAQLRLVSLVDDQPGNGRPPDVDPNDVQSRLADLPVQTDVRTGKPEDEIASIAVEDDGTIFVIPRELAVAMLDRLSSAPLSTDQQRIRQPVLLAARDQANHKEAVRMATRPDRSLIVVDSPLACEQMIDQARLLLGSPGSHIHVLWALRPPTWFSRTLNHALMVETLQFLHERGADCIERALNRASAAGHSVSWSQSTDLPISGQIVRAAEKLDADVIVLPSSLGERLLRPGQVLTDLLGETDRPMLLLDASARNRDQPQPRPEIAATPGAGHRSGSPVGSRDDGDTPTAAELAGRIRDD